MNFTWIDWFSGFMLLGALVHLVMSHANMPFPSLFGRTRRANLIHSVLAAGVAVDLYIFTYGFSAMLSNGLLLGALDMYLVYLIFGRWLHGKLQPVEGSVQEAQRSMV